jgi:hypothetical protein
MFSFVIHGANNMAKPAEEVGELVPDPKVFQEFDVSPMTGYRWDHSEELIALGWPPPIRIGQRKYGSRKALEAFKAALMRRAINERRK